MTELVKMIDLYDSVKKYTEFHSARELSSKTGVSRDTISKWLKNKHVDICSIPFGSGLKLCHELGISDPNQFLASCNDDN